MRDVELRGNTWCMMRCCSKRVNHLFGNDMSSINAIARYWSSRDGDFHPFNAGHAHSTCGVVGLYVNDNITLCDSPGMAYASNN